MKKTGAQNGFTLVEMLVSVSIFTIVAFIAIASLLQLQDQLRKARLLRAAMSNVEVAMEGIMRKVRVGDVYHCKFGKMENPRDCRFSSGGGDNFAFRSTDAFGNKKQYYYRFDNSNGAIEMATCDPPGASDCESTSDFVDEDFRVITSPEVEIRELRFYVRDAHQGPGRPQPFVTMVVEGEAKLPGKPDLDTDFILQTSASKRSVLF